MASKAELHRKGYEAFGTGDMATLTDLIAEDTVWHAAGDSPTSGDFRGRDAVFQNFMKIAELTGGTFSLEVHDLLESDDHTVGVLKVSATREGKSFNGDAVEVIHWSGGKVAEEWFMFFDQKAADEFLS